MAESQRRAEENEAAAYLLRDRLVPHLPRPIQSYLRSYDTIPTFDDAARGQPLTPRAL